MRGLALAWLLAGAPARAGTLYVNGVRADGLRDQRLEDVDVYIDAQGDIHVEAPQYRVEVEGASEKPSPPSASEVPRETWWLATEDRASEGQDCDLLVNGVLAVRVRSGEGPAIVDLAPWLRRGANALEFQCGGGGPGGGTLAIHVGQGANRGGTVVIDDPVVSLVRRPRQPPETRTFTLTVP